MNIKAKQRTLAALRARIARIERQPVMNGMATVPSGNAPWRALPGMLGEVWCDRTRDTGAGIGFALGTARALIGATRPAILFLQLAHEAKDRGLPYGPGLAHFGIDPDRFVIGRMDRIEELLWATEEAVACRSVAAVIADIGGAPKPLDFTASRRLNLRAAASGGAIFLVRYGHEREASAAGFRWHVAPARSSPAPFDRRAPGTPRLKVTLEKGSRRQGVRHETEWLLEWTANGWDRTDRKPRAEPAVAGTAPHGALPAALGDRLPQTG